MSMSNTRFNNRAHVMCTGAWCSCLQSHSPVVVFCVERLSCRHPDIAVKEIWVYLLAYNLIRMIDAVTIRKRTGSSVAVLMGLML